MSHLLASEIVELTLGLIWVWLSSRRQRMRQILVRHGVRTGRRSLAVGTPINLRWQPLSASFVPLTPYFSRPRTTERKGPAQLRRPSLKSFVGLR